MYDQEFKHLAQCSTFFRATKGRLQPEHCALDCVRGRHSEDVWQRQRAERWEGLGGDWLKVTFLANGTSLR